MYFNTVSLSSYSPADKKETFAARTKACAQRVAYKVRKHFNLARRGESPTRAAEKSPLPFTPRDSRRPGNHASTWLS